MERLLQRWKQYRYRFVPWIALNLKDRSVRSVPKGATDKLATDSLILHTLTSLLQALHHDSDTNLTKDGDLYRKSRKQQNTQHDPSTSNGGLHRKSSKQHDDIHHDCDSQIGDMFRKSSKLGDHIHHDSGDGDLFRKSSKLGDNVQDIASRNLAIMEDILGFTVERRVSSIEGGGRGVAVTRGSVPKGSVTSLYPGLIYENYEPILFQSLGNPFIFRCIDSLLIDGNDKGISRFLYRSCHGRDRVGPYALCDKSWLTERPLNPLAVGQYVNNHNRENPANVAYQEFDVPADFPLHLRQYLPNNYYSSSLETLHQQQRLTRLVVLVATRDIQCGEELFSSYFTVVH